MVKGWAVHSDGELVLTDEGRFICRRSLNFGITASYRPMLARIDNILFVNFAGVFLPDQDGHEAHVDRTLNVIGSGFQHERYFEDIDEIILSIFNHRPISKQPRYVVDMVNYVYYL